MNYVSRLRREGDKRDRVVSLAARASTHAFGKSQRKMKFADSSKNNECRESQQKKVKFADSLKNHEYSEKKQASALTAEETHSHNVDDMKTFEYRSFKRLWEESGRESHHNLSLEKDSNLKTSESTFCGNDLNKIFFLIEKTTPLVQRPLLSPAMASQNFDENSVCPNLSAAPAVDGNFTAFAQSADLGNKHGGIFASKRENILRFASKALSLEIDELKSRRSDLVPEFLQRLGISRKLSNLLPMKSYDVCLPPASPKAEHQYEDLHEIQVKELVPSHGSGEKMRAYRNLHANEVILPLPDTTEEKAVLTWSPPQTCQWFSFPKLSSCHEDLHEAVGNVLVATDTRRQLRTKFLSSSSIEDNELTLPSRNSLEAPETSFQSSRMQSNWASNTRSISGPPLVDNSAEFGKHEVDFDYLVHSKFGSHWDSSEQALLPRIKPPFLKVSKQNTLLLGWREEDAKEEPGLPMYSEGLFQFDQVHLPPVPYSAPYFLDQTPVSGFGVDNRKAKFVCDASEEDLDDLLLSPRPDFEFKFETWEMDFDRTFDSLVSASIFNINNFDITREIHF